MSKKFTFYAFDEVAEYSFEKADIYTNKYSSLLKPNSLHIVDGAKFILLNKKQITILIAAQPIVMTDGSGNVIVHTQTDMKLATLKSISNFLNENPYELLKVEHSALKNKAAFGISAEESVRKKIIESKLAICKLIASLRKVEEGGGFNV